MNMLVGNFSILFQIIILILIKNKVIKNIIKKFQDENCMKSSQIPFKLAIIPLVILS